MEKDILLRLDLCDVGRLAFEVRYKGFTTIVMFDPGFIGKYADRNMRTLLEAEFAPWLNQLDSTDGQ